MQLIAQVLPNVASDRNRSSLFFYYWETGNRCHLQIAVRNTKLVLVELRRDFDGIYQIVLYKEVFGKRFDTALATLSVGCQIAEPRDPVIGYGRVENIDDLIHALSHKHSIELTISDESKKWTDD